MEERLGTSGLRRDLDLERGSVVICRVFLLTSIAAVGINGVDVRVGEVENGRVGSRLRSKLSSLGRRL
jgi:hypothetical protein